MAEISIPLLEKLIAIKSTSMDLVKVGEIIDFVQDYLSESKLSVRRFANNNYPSLLIAKEPQQKFKLILNAHLDVVPGPEDFFRMQTKDDHASGRGVFDMKGAAAVMIQLFKDLSEQDTLPAGVGLMLVSDEEIGGKNGTRYQLQEQNITCDFFVAGEPTNLEICTELKGLLHIQITQKGKAAHGSKPWEGKNANIALAEKIAAFYKTNRELTENIWETTYNLSLLKGGKAENVVSDEATAYFDIRRIEQDTAEKIIERLKAFFPDTTLSVVRNEIPLKTSAEDKHIALLKRLIENETKKETKIIKETYAADGRYYSGAGTPSINFGLVGGGMHADDEWIDLKSIPVYYEILKAFLLSV